MTILFSDLVGSTPMTSRHDPEEWRANIASYQRAASDAIRRFGGEVVRYVGDGIMAFFGYPFARENDAERAARAGLVEAITGLNAPSAHAQLSVRVGIDSGEVVVGAGSNLAIDAFGDAANIAARVQALAARVSLLVTGATHRLIAGLFVVEERGFHSLKGLSRPVQLYRVIRPSGIRGRFEVAAASGGLIPFIGREEELYLLLNRWRRVRKGQVALIIGEARIGKSRLMRRFRDVITGTPHTWLEAGAGALFQNTAFHPISDLFQQFLTEGDTIKQLASRLTAAGLNPTEAVPLVASMLNLSLPTMRNRV